MKIKPQINSIVKEFIQEHIDLIDADNWNEIYFQLERAINKGDMYAHATNEFTEAMLTAGIDVFEHLTFVPSLAFDFSRIKNISFPENIIGVNTLAFNDCPNLESVDLTYIKRLQPRAFSGCSSLVEVKLSNRLGIIGSYAFYECPLLTTLHFDGTIEEWQNVHKDRYWNSQQRIIRVLCNDGKEVV